MLEILNSDFEKILFGIVFGGWCISLLAESLIIKRSGKRTIKSKEDRGTYYLLYFSILFSIILSVSLGLNESRQLTGIVFYIGILLLVSGTLLRELAVYTLGKYFTLQVTVVENQTLIKTGPYRYIRHPGYAGLLLALVGLSMCFQSLKAMILVLVLNSLVIGLRIRLEEHLMAKVFGTEFTDYKSKTKRIIPFLL